mmetsp:Transcript_29547/g.52797  ORF Transcript_29547/g.52797 Transcript_29547/m.52797 type:complete len:172 (-) Transcript_29547:66-581(-)
MNFDLSDFELEFAEPDPEHTESKQEKKRRQNRESAARVRARKKLDVMKAEENCTKLEEVHSQLTIDNVALKTENEMLRKELEFYRSILHNSQKPSGNAKPSFWALSLVCTLCLICLSSPGTELISTSGRRLLSVPTGAQSGYWVVSFLVAVFVCWSLMRSLASQSKILPGA